ncbi:MAG: orotate phosphoribosyltransferase [Akkermansia sp.]|uniref:orotate phosphoribosyltransferase n=1 Tax=Akkermansia sp. TaxID=1872421 RepID=UPI0025BBE243|nr:orotate phosphoribosyltransferase [Akkermansia sp.]MBS5508879.1 orotate phosphoribosyltransferase [Akkermansia sp.]MCD8064961.1 orotate phosphoribosyltransferase [Akkermansia sp.]
MSEQYDLLKSILLEKSVRTGTFTLASGKVSDLYVDCRMTALDPVGATLVGALGWKLVREEILPRFPEVAAIGGMTMGADPISLAVGMTSALEGAEKKLQVFTVRKEPKDHGRGRRIEGNFQAGDTVVVVDDVITTGGSTLKAIDAIEAEGGKVAAALVLLDREEGGRQAIEERGIPVYPLYTRTSLLGK